MVLAENIGMNCRMIMRAVIAVLLAAGLALPDQVTTFRYDTLDRQRRSSNLVGRESHGRRPGLSQECVSSIRELAGFWRERLI
jgi:hypothetical protein